MRAKYALVLGNPADYKRAVCMWVRHCIVYLAVSVSYKVYTGHTYRITSDWMWLSIYSHFFFFIFTFFAVFSLLFSASFDIDLLSIWKRTLWPKRCTTLGNYWSSFCVSVILRFLATIIIIIIIAVRLVGWSLDRSLVRTHRLKQSWSTWRVTSINYFDKHGNFCVRFCSQSHFHLLV